MKYVNVKLILTLNNPYIYLTIFLFEILKALVYLYNLVEMSSTDFLFPSILVWKITVPSFDKTSLTLHLGPLSVYVRD